MEDDMKENIIPKTPSQSVPIEHNNTISIETKRNASELKSILCKRKKMHTDNTLLESGTDRRVHFNADVKTSSPAAKIARKRTVIEEYPRKGNNTPSRNIRSTRATHNASRSLNLTPTTFYQPESLIENSSQNANNAQIVELSSEARKQVQLLTVKALEQENESLRQRILQKRMELMYLLQQRSCPNLPHILPSTYNTIEDGDSFRLIGETLNTLFID